MQCECDLLARLRSYFRRLLDPRTRFGDAEAVAVGLRRRDNGILSLGQVQCLGDWRCRIGLDVQDGGAGDGRGREKRSSHRRR